MRIFLLVIFFSIQFAGAATYYVDFDGGSDANNGTSSATPWKHHPDDSNAASNANIVLSAGDTVYLKGGVTYHGALNFQSSGTAGSKITHSGDASVHGWGTGRAIIDGTTNLTWNVCTAQGTNATQVNNASFGSIYYATLPSGANWTIPVIEGTNVLSKAGSPNTVEPFLVVNTDYYEAIASGISSSSVTDSGFLNQSDTDYWDGAIVVIHSSGNSTSFGGVTNFNISTDTLEYHGAGTPYQATDWDNNYHYTVINAQPQVTQGAYCVDTNRGMIFVWPSSSISNVRVGSLANAIHTQAQSYHLVTGIIFRGHFGTAFVNGRYITGNNATGTDGLIIDSCEFYGGVANGATAGVYLLSTDAGTSNNVVRNCHMRFSDTRGLFGAGNGFIFQSNELHRVTGTVLYSLATASRTNRNGQYLDNYIHDCSGTHANGMTIYGVNNYTARNFVVARNRVIRQYQRYGPFALTVQYHSDIHFENNVLDGEIADDGPQVGSYIRWYNNTITKYLRIFLASNVTDCIVKNNIILTGLRNNAGEDWADITRDSNIYETLAGRQEVGYGWTMESGGFVTNSTALFGGAFTDGVITASSAAYNEGVDVSSEMLEDLDAARTTRPQATLWDIGAYEYQAGGGSSTYRGFSFGSGVKLIGPGRLTQ